MPGIRSPRGPPFRAISARAVSTMPGLRSVETCTSAGPCGALELAARRKQRGKDRDAERVHGRAVWMSRQNCQ